MLASARGEYNDERKRRAAGGGGVDVATDELTKLAAAVERHSGSDGVYETAVPALALSRFSAPSDLVALVYEPCVCLVAQGAKEVLLEGETYRLDPARSCRAIRLLRLSSGTLGGAAYPDVG
jgi:hypothetical protein